VLPPVPAVSTAMRTSNSHDTRYLDLQIFRRTSMKDSTEGKGRPWCASWPDNRSRQLPAVTCADNRAVITGTGWVLRTTVSPRSGLRGFDTRHPLHAQHATYPASALNVQQFLATEGRSPLVFFVRRRPFDRWCKRRRSGVGQPQSALNTSSPNQKGQASAWPLFMSS